MKKISTYLATFLVAVSALLVAPASEAQVNPAEFNKLMEGYLKTAEGKKLLGSTVENYFKNRQAEMKKDREKSQAKQLEEQFKNPVKVDVGTSPVKGPKDAAVTIIEFSDFQCPYCSRANQTVEQVLKEYKGKVRVSFKNLPLPFHKEADPAARAALAANKQGKFWEMHDALFENQRKLSSQLYDDLAKKLGMNVEKFKKDMDAADVKKQVAEDMALAKKHGISGTPGFFVNGVAVKGALPFPHFKSIIDRLLAKK